MLRILIPLVRACVSRSAPQSITCIDNSVLYHIVRLVLGSAVDLAQSRVGLHGIPTSGPRAHSIEAQVIRHLPTSGCDNWIMTFFRSHQAIAMDDIVVAHAHVAQRVNCNSLRLHAVASAHSVRTPAS